MNLESKDCVASSSSCRLAAAERFVLQLRPASGVGGLTLVWLFAMAWLGATTAWPHKSLCFVAPIVLIWLGFPACYRTVLLRGRRAITQVHLSEAQDIELQLRGYPSRLPALSFAGTTQLGGRWLWFRARTPIGRVAALIDRSRVDRSACVRLIWALRRDARRGAPASGQEAARLARKL
jgi:hypothetical protein